MNKFILKATVAVIRTSLNALSFFSKEKAGEAGATIFSKPRKGKITEENKKYLDTAEKETLYYEKIPIQTYKWRGDIDKKVLLVHGWESNSARWKPLITKLQKENFTIIALDAPAHGDSGNKYFNQFQFAGMINVLIEKYLPQSIIGHSAGGFAVSYAYFKYKPMSVKKIALLAPVSDNRIIFDMFFNYLNTHKRVREGFYAVFRKKYGDPDKLTVAEFSKFFDIKALIIHDKNDEVVPYPESEKIHNSWKNSELILTENIGHSLRHEQIYKIIITFLISN